MKKILLFAAIMATNSLQAQLDYEDDMTGAVIDPVWNVNITTVATLDDPNDQIDYNHVEGTTRRLLSDVNGFVSKTMYFKASISNFTGASVVFIGFVEDGPANNANYASTVVSGNHTYEMFFNNTSGALPFDNGAGWTGTLNAGEGLWTTNGGINSAALTVGGAVDPDKAMSGFGFANFGNELTFPSASFSIDSAAAHLSLILPGAGNIPPTATITAPSDGTNVAEGVKHQLYRHGCRYRRRNSRRKHSVDLEFGWKHWYWSQHQCCDPTGWSSHDYGKCHGFRDLSWKR